MTPATLTVGGRPASVLGTFGKGCDGSAALNFGESGGANCSTACPYHPRTTSGMPPAGPDATPPRWASAVTGRVSPA